jgi:hypothetical protein
MTTNQTFEQYFCKLRQLMTSDVWRIKYVKGPEIRDVYHGFAFSYYSPQFESEVVFLFFPGKMNKSLPTLDPETCRLKCQYIDDDPQTIDNHKNLFKDLYNEYASVLEKY